MSVETISLGCRLNFAESATLAAQAPKGEDWTIVNSCAVTSEAVRQSRQAIRRAHRDRPNAHILVTGCASDRDPDAFASLAGVTRVVANRSKFQTFNRDVKTPVAAGQQSKIKSFVAIQNGCDHRCTFCAIWQARGPSVTLSLEAVRDAIERELDRGSKEIILTGVDITDVEGGLGVFCQRLLTAVPRLPRLRLSSLDSVEMDDALFELVSGEARLMPHFHLSLQSGDDLTLKRMKRRHSRRDAIRTVERIKAARADATIGADLIAGFPTESEDMHINNLKILNDCDIVAAHIFPFSPRPDTPAARMPQVPRDIVKARAAELRAAAADRRGRWLEGEIGRTLPVLIEGDGIGHSDHNAPIALPGAKRGDTGFMRTTARDGDRLVGEWA